MYTYHQVLQILMPTLRLLIFGYVLLVGMFEVFKPAKPQILQLKLF